MPSFHLKNGVGPVVRCAHDDCKLHHGTDFKARDYAQAQAIGEDILRDMYNGVEIHGLASRGMEQDRAVEKKLTLGDVFVDKSDASEVGQRLNAIADYSFLESAKYRSPSYSPDSIRKVMDDNIARTVNGQLSDDDIARTLDSYDGSIESLSRGARASQGLPDDAEPTDRQLVQEIYGQHLRAREEDALSDHSGLRDSDRRRIHHNANEILRGNVDMNAAYVKSEQRSLDIARAHLRDAQTDEMKDYLKKEIAAHNRNLKRGTMPAADRRRVIQNAWSNASPAARRETIRNANADVLRYAPSTDVARSLRHRSIDDRFRILNALGATDKSAMTNAIIMGGVGRSDAMTWVNRHKVRDVDGNVDNTNRTINAFLRSTYTEQGMSRYTPSRTRTLARQLGDPKRFVDASGHYSPAAHARALYAVAYGTGVRMKNGKRDNGYLPLATKIISSRRVPKSAMIQFESLSAGRAETTRANSQYNTAYAATHKDRKSGEAVYMSRWHALQAVIPHIYGDVAREGGARHAHRVTLRSQEHDE